MKLRTIRRTAVAFTLVEVLVALTLFIVALLGVLQLLPITQRYLQQSAFSTQASFLAQQQLENIRNTTYASLTVGASPAYEPLAPVSAVAGDPNSRFLRTTVIEYVDPAASYATTNTDTRMKRVTITLTWPEGRRTASYVLKSLVNDR
jgi:Tfp pilus assembly protein PilV